MIPPKKRKLMMITPKKMILLRIQKEMIGKRKLLTLKGM